MVPTYTKSQITDLKNNYNGATPDAGYISGWNLTLDGLASGLTISLGIRNLMARFSIDIDGLLIPVGCLLQVSRRLRRRGSLSVCPEADQGEQAETQEDKLVEQEHPPFAGHF